ncbi:TPA: hypothetical protein ENX78_10440 [Candidatus Poribacteria bacterium]|nr:hypothetical protein [Candidatus Poribacteria bacterium]
MNNKHFIRILILIAIIVFGLIGCSEVQTNDQLTINEEDTSVKNGEVSGGIRPDDPNVVVMGSSDASSFGPGWYKLNVEELEKDSVAILKVTALYSENPDYEALSKMPIGNIEPEEVQVTLTTVRVDEVYKSDCNLKIGDEVVIEEDYRTYPDSNKENTIIVETAYGMLPMNKGEQYLVFLKKQPDDAEVKFGEDYYFNSGWHGKYPITEKTINSASINGLTTEDLEFNEAFVDDHLLTLAEQVYQRYIWK